MKLKEFAKVFDSNVIFYLYDFNNHNKILDKCSVSHIKNSAYKDYKVMEVKLLYIGLSVLVKE